MTISKITLAFVLFVVGMLLLLFGKTKNPIYDLLGFFLAILGFMVLYSETP